MRRLLSIAFATIALAGFATAYSQAPSPGNKPSASTSSTATKPKAAPDPSQSDGDKYHVILENEFVRVLRYHDEPGQKTHLHHHPNAFVMYALKPFRRRLSFPDGKVRERVFAEGDIDWVPAQTHSGENIGSAATEGLLVEVKRCGP